jgi:hypothetical protein
MRSCWKVIVTRRMKEHAILHITDDRTETRRSLIVTTTMLQIIQEINSIICPHFHHPKRTPKGWFILSVN